jgi:V/A-type H+-transporting ATPase subunit I
MLKPEPMTKVVICGLNEDLSKVSNILSKTRLVHVENYAGEDEGFLTGTTLDYGARVSEVLVRVRSLIKILDVDAGSPADVKNADLVESEVFEKLDDLEKNILEIYDNNRSSTQKLKDGTNHLELMEKFESFNINLEYFSGFKSLNVLTGILSSNTEFSVTNGEVIRDDDMIAVFVPVEDSEDVERKLIKSGFKSVDPPSGEGPIGKGISVLKSDLQNLESEIEATGLELEALSNRHGQWLVVAEEHFAAQSEKSSLPLKLALSKNAFVLDGWIPVKESDDLKNSLDEINLDIQFVSSDAVPPVKLDNPKVVKPFELFTKLYSTPDHRELDPSVLLFFGYPLFFGLMIGDLGYGFFYFLLGHFLVKKYRHSDELYQLGQIIRLSGFSAFFFGTVLFAEAFGFALGKDGGILSFLQHDFVLDKGNGDHVGFMLLASGAIGLFYVTLGLVMGFYNAMNMHNLKHAIQEKLSWIMILWGGLSFIPPWLFGSSLIGSRIGLPEDIEFWVGLSGFLIGLVLAVSAEGVVALVEVPSIFVQVISYVRIAALGVADYGLAHAFNGMAIDIGFSGVSIIPALLILVVGQLVVFTLGLIGSGINSLRLQYVECFPKFFIGGGTDYTPFGYTRKYTHETETTV